MRVPAVDGDDGKRPFALSLRTLLLLGSGCEVVYLCFAWVYPLPRYYQVDNDMAGFTGHSGFAFVALLSAFSVLFLLFGLACWGVGMMDDGRRLRLVLGFGALFALTMTLVYPITAIDVFGYVAESVILTQYHQNPISTPPSHFPNDPIMGLTGSWAGGGAPYGPLGIIIDAVPSLVAQHSLLANLILLKLMFSAMALLSAVLAYRILRCVAPAWALRGAVLIAWNPLVPFQASANGHNDIAMMFLVVLGLFALAKDRLLVGVILVAASALVKFATVLLLPLVIVYAIAQQPSWPRRVILAVEAIAAALAVAIVLYAPFWFGLATFSRTLQENGRHIESFSSVMSILFPAQLTVDQATMWGRFLFLPVYVLSLWLAAHRFADFMRGCFLTMFFFLAIGSGTFEVWYVVWPTVIAAATPWPAAWLCVALLGYGASQSAALYNWVWPWLGLDNPGSFPLVNNVSYIISFVPATLTLLGSMLWRALPLRHTPMREVTPLPNAADRTAE
jgi:hypothetical protein